MSSSPQHTGAEPKPEGTAADQSLSPCYESKPGAPPHIRFSLYEIVLENLDPSIITLDTLMVYFRSEASCGGSLDEDRCSFDEDTGEAIITFIDADVTHRVLRRKEHMVGSMNVTIKAGKEQPIRVQNNKCLVIYKQHEIDKEDLTLLIKAKWNHTFPGIKIPGFDMEFNADDSAALVTFAQPVYNMAELIEKISGKLLGDEVSAKLVNKTHSIMVENLPPKIDNDYLSLLFDSLECPAYRVEQVKHDGTAIVHLKATEYVDSICDLARRGELKLKKAALTCWPFLPEFHSVNSGNAHHQTVVGQHNTQPQLAFPVHTGPISSIEIEGAFQLRFFFRPQLVVIAYKANLLRAKVDVIVSPANTTLTAEGGIAQQLAEAAGLRYVNNCQTYIDRKGPLTLGDTVNASSGNLPKPIRGVVHAICRPTNDLSQAQIEAMLQDVIFKSLQMADEQSEAASVALPSVWGTNNAPDVVAECLLRTACKYNEHTRSSKRTSNLKEIHITSASEKMNEQMITCLAQWIHKLSPPDQAVIPPLSPRYLPQGEVPPKLMHLQTDEGLLVLVRHADIVNFKADAVVCPMDKNAAIMTAAGKYMWQEYDDYFKSHAPLRAGQVLRTSAGNMTPRVQHILHVKCPDYQPGCDSVSSLRAAFFQCLTSANDHHAASISLPPLGLETRGFTVKDTATAAYGAILDFSHRIRNKSTKHINLLHTDSTIMDEIQTAFRQLIEDQLNGKSCFCSQMFIKEEGDKFNNPPNAKLFLNEEPEAGVYKRIEDPKRMHGLRSRSETGRQPARRTRHLNSHMSLDIGLDSDVSTQKRPVRLQSGGKPAIMQPLTASNTRVSKTPPQTHHAPRNIPKKEGD